MYISATHRSPAEPLKTRRQSGVRKKPLGEPYLRGNDELGDTTESFGPHAVHAQANGDLLKGTARACDAQPKIVIVAPGRVQPSHFLEYAPSHERGGLIDNVVAVPKGVLEVPGSRHKIEQELPSLVDEACCSEDNIHLRLLLKDLHCGANGAGRPYVVGIQPNENFPFAKLPAPVDSVECTTIGLGQPANTITVALKQVNGTVC
jgi:hypothetical protein